MKKRIETICKIVSKEFRVAQCDLVGGRRFQDVADARHVAMDISVQIVGRDPTLEYFKRDRTLINHMRTKLRDMRQTYQAFNTKYEHARQLAVKTLTP